MFKIWSILVTLKTNKTWKWFEKYFSVYSQETQKIHFKDNANQMLFNKK